MNRRTLLKQLPLAAAAVLDRQTGARAAVHTGPFQPTWNSLSTYQIPAWFADAKFGMWAHWGPQCQPEQGDWYARRMYQQGSPAYRSHLQTFGHPSRFGFKDILPLWRADQWEPDALLSLYQAAGAHYFLAMAVHEDNFDLYASRHQPWNSVAIGPRRDVVAGWARAARARNLPFGVTVHSSHAWTWMEPAQFADASGPLAGVPYDGNTLASAGPGTWWNGRDPQQLYTQRHPLSTDAHNPDGITPQWVWGSGAAIPSPAYIETYRRRVLQLIDDYHPDLLYFDDTVLPFWPISTVGLEIASHFYNTDIHRHGHLQAILFGKILAEGRQRRSMVWDIERGQSNRIEPLPWQTDTCIGDWHYKRSLYDNHGYKSAQTVIQTLVDVVSKNGNLVLNIPVRGNGSIDDQELAIVQEIGRWNALNGASIFATRPWTLFGEGPGLAAAPPLAREGFNEGKAPPLTPRDLRFTTRGETLYATFFGWPTPDSGHPPAVRIQALAAASPHRPRPIRSVTLLATGHPLAFRQTPEALLVTLPATPPPLAYASVLQIA